MADELWNRILVHSIFRSGESIKVATAFWYSFCVQRVPSSHHNSDGGSKVELPSVAHLAVSIRIDFLPEVIFEKG